MLSTASSILSGTASELLMPGPSRWCWPLWWMFILITTATLWSVEAWPWSSGGWIYALRSVRIGRFFVLVPMSKSTSTVSHVLLLYSFHLSLSFIFGLTVVCFLLLTIPAPVVCALSPQCFLVVDVNGCLLPLPIAKFVIEFGDVWCFGCHFLGISCHLWEMCQI